MSIVKVKSPAKITHKAGKERRSAAKTMLLQWKLAILYGMSPKTAGARMGKTEAEGKELMDNFFRQFPKVEQLMLDSKKMLEEKGYVTDWAGRRRRLPDFNLPAYEVSALKKTDDASFNPFLGCEDKPAVDPAVIAKWTAIKDQAVKDSQDKQRERCAKNGVKWVENDEMSNTAYEKLAQEARKEGVLITANTGRRAQAERQCLNSRVQGGAASLTKLAMVNVHNDKELKDLDAHLIITVHDEVLVECPIAYAGQVEKRLPQVMIDTAKPFFNVPMACDPYAERQWYIGEYSTSIQAEFKKLEEKGVEKEEALAKVIANHPEMFPEAIKATIETGEEIDIDAYEYGDEYIEDFDIKDDEIEDEEEEEASPYVSLFE